MVKPIFVIGKHRSGTTMLANVLCMHPKIVGIQHPIHYGIHESAYFSHIVNRYGDLRKHQNYVEFVEVLCSSDYFKIAGIDCEYFYALKSRDYYEIFKLIMDGYADEHNTDYWLEKTPENTLYTSNIAAEYPEAKFIAIIRDSEDYLVSTLGHLKRKKSHFSKLDKVKSIFKTMIARSYYNKSIKDINKSKRCLIINYESLINNESSELKRMGEYLNLKFDKGISAVRFKPNTSFSSGIKPVLTRVDLIISKVSQLIGLIIPLSVFKIIHKIYRGFRKHKDLPDWFFRMHEKS